MECCVYLLAKLLSFDVPHHVKNSVLHKTVHQLAVAYFDSLSLSSCVAPYSKLA